MRKKRISVIIRREPITTLKNSEALRMCVGLTMVEGNQVRIIFLGDGVYTLKKTSPEKVCSSSYDHAIEMLQVLKCDLIVEKKALLERKISYLHHKVTVMNREEINCIRKKSDINLTY